MMTKKDLYNDFLLIKSMSSPERIKRKFITNLFDSTENPWRVVGITKAALEIFKNHDFKKVSRMGVNRSHILSRKDSYSILLNKEFSNCNDWWDFYYENDKTVLSTSNENLRKVDLVYLPFEKNTNLFQSKGYAWRHGKKEINFLKELYKQNSQ